MIFKLEIFQKRILTLLLIGVLIFEVGTDKLQRGDYYKYLPGEIHGNIFNPPAYQLITDGNSNDFSMQDFITENMKLVFLKLGILTITKAVLIFTFIAFFFKLTFFLSKIVAAKVFLFPFITVALLYHYILNDKDEYMNETTTAKPENSTSQSRDFDSINRNLNINSLFWEKIQTYAESDECLKRIYCLIGAKNTTSNAGKKLSRMIELSNQSDLAGIQERISHFKQAYNRGKETLTCPQAEFRCRLPELIIRSLNKI